MLVIEDDPDDFLITRDLLNESQGMRFTVEHAASFEDGHEQIARHEHDVCLVDHYLGQRTGLDLVREAFPASGQAPVIMLTGHDDYRVDQEASEIGVTDFLLKNQLSAAILERSIRYALRHHRMLSELSETKERYSLAVEGANDGIWDWDLEAGVVYYARRWKALLGHSDDEIGDSPEEWLGRVQRDDRPRLSAAIDAHLEGRTPSLESEHQMRTAAGEIRWMSSRGLAVRDEAGKAIRIAGSMSDIHDRKLAEEQLVHDALHDALTGLPNRARFVDHVQLSLGRSRRSPGHVCAVLFLDLDRFKLINDGHSHAVGDQLLVAVGRRLVTGMRPGDTVARLGGDEFAILLDGIADDQEALVVAGRVRGLLAKPVDVGGRQLTVSGSIGIGLNEPGATPEDLIRNADIAMYEAKRERDDEIGVFDDTMRSRVVKRLAIEAELREIIANGEMEVVYQPIVELSSGRIDGFEALSRWPAGRADDVPPVEFIPVAESLALISDLGRHVLARSLQQLAEWRDAGLVDESASVSVNIAGRQLGHEQLLAEVRDALQSASLPSEVLRLEITESTMMREPESMPAALDALEGIGVNVHIDDFGTGYSSLTFLRHFAGRTLKIDRSFIAAIPEDEDSLEIVRTILSLAETLDLEVIAEGVEQEAQIQALRDLGCRCAQGFLLARPAPPAAIAKMLRSWDQDWADRFDQAGPA